MSEEQEAKYGAIPAEVSKTAQRGVPPKKEDPKEDKKKDE